MNLGNTKIEVGNVFLSTPVFLWFIKGLLTLMYCLLLQLLYPLGDNSPIAGFLKNKPDGGIHHVCIEVNLKIYEQNGRARRLGGGLHRCLSRVPGGTADCWVHSPAVTHCSQNP